MIGEVILKNVTTRLKLSDYETAQNMPPKYVEINQVVLFLIV